MAAEVPKIVKQWGPGEHAESEARLRPERMILIRGGSPEKSQVSWRLAQHAACAGRAVSECEAG